MDLFSQRIKFSTNTVPIKVGKSVYAEVFQYFLIQDGARFGLHFWQKTAVFQKYSVGARNVWDVICQFDIFKFAENTCFNRCGIILNLN